MAMTDTERVRKRLTRLIEAAHNENYDFIYIPVGTAKVILKLLEEQPQIVRCKDCKHRPKEVPFKTTWGATETYLDFPKGSKCPCQNSGDTYYSWNPDDTWFCADGERRDDNVRKTTL